MSAVRAEIFSRVILRCRLQLTLPRASLQCTPSHQQCPVGAGEAITVAGVGGSVTTGIGAQMPNSGWLPRFFEWIQVSAEVKIDQSVRICCWFIAMLCACCTDCASHLQQFVCLGNLVQS